MILGVAERGSSVQWSRGSSFHGRTWPEWKFPCKVEQNLWQIQHLLQPWKWSHDRLFNWAAAYDYHQRYFHHKASEYSEINQLLHASLIWDCSWISCALPLGMECWESYAVLEFDVWKIKLYMFAWLRVPCKMILSLVICYQWNWSAKFYLLTWMDLNDELFDHN